MKPVTRRCEVCDLPEASPSHSAGMCVCARRGQCHCRFMTDNKTFNEHLENCDVRPVVKATFPNLALFDHHLCDAGRALFRADNKQADSVNESPELSTVSTERATETGSEMQPCHLCGAKPLILPQFALGESEVRQVGFAVSVNGKRKLCATGDEAKQEWMTSQNARADIATRTEGRRPSLKRCLICTHRSDQRHGNTVASNRTVCVTCGCICVFTQHIYRHDPSFDEGCSLPINSLDFCNQPQNADVHEREWVTVRATRTREVEDDLRQLIIDSQQPHGTCYWGLGLMFSSATMKEECVACAAKRRMRSIANGMDAPISQPQLNSREVFQAGWDAGFQEALEPDRFPDQNRCEVRYRELFRQRISQPENQEVQVVHSIEDGGYGTPDEELVILDAVPAPDVSELAREVAEKIAVAYSANSLHRAGVSETIITIASIPTPYISSPRAQGDRKQVCVQCKHGDGINERGQCVHYLADAPTAHPSPNARWEELHCGHKCIFPPDSEDVEAACSSCGWDKFKRVCERCLVTDDGTELQKVREWKEANHEANRVL